MVVRVSLLFFFVLFDLGVVYRVLFYHGLNSSLQFWGFWFFYFYSCCSFWLGILAETRDFLDTSSNEDHFSDAPEGPDATVEGDNCKRLPTSPLVLVEKTDERKVLGIEAFEKRTADASPDMTPIQPSPDLPVDIPGAFSGDSEGEWQEKEEVETPRSEVPITIVERVDSTPAHGEVPGTEAFAKRLADAAPDVIRTATSSPIPVTVVSVVDSDEPLHGEVPGAEVHKMRTADAQPDVVVKWNEEEDKISRKVRSERERIEKLMMDPGRARSVSPGQGPKAVAPVVRARMDSLSMITLPIGEAKGKKEEREKGVNGVEKEDKVDDIAEEQPSRSRSSSISSQKCGSSMLVGNPEITVDAPIETKAEDTEEETKEEPAEKPEVEEVREAAKSQVIDDFSAGDGGNVEEKEEEEDGVVEEDEEATTKEDEIKEEEEEDDDGGFGDDDFDDFGEVVEGEEFDDFGGFGEAEPFEPSPPPPPQIPVIPVPVLDFEKLDNEDAVRRAAAEAMAKMFPIDKAKYQNITPISVDDNVFLTERRFVYHFL